MKFDQQLSRQRWKRGSAARNEARLNGCNPASYNKPHRPGEVKELFDLFHNICCRNEKQFMTTSGALEGGFAAAAAPQRPTPAPTYPIEWMGLEEKANIPARDIHASAPPG